MIVERDTQALECECHGYASRIESTPQEIASQSCGKSYACCIATFVCHLCGKRWTVQLEAPEME